MRILFATFVNPALFSGGRYHALLMAEAMAAGGHYVSVWASAKPRFWSDFETLPRHKQIALTIDPSLANPPAGPFDLVMIVPDLRDDPTMYAAALKRAAACEARVGLLSFETPNWFNEHALVERDEALWWYWRETARNADLIVASTALGARYARAFYADPENADAIVSCPPSINSLVADATPAPPRARQIVCLTRFGTRDFHKGGDELTALLHPSLAGLELVVFHGTGAAPSPTALDALHAAAEKARMGLRFLDYTTDAEKFEELKKSAAIVAPSYFEGFGYPPIEALYCGTPCIAFDLPVYRETCGSALITTPPGDMAAMRGAVIDVLEGKQANARPHDTERLRDIASFDRFVDRTNALLSNLQQSTAPRRNTGTIQVRPTPGNQRSGLRARIANAPGVAPIRTFIELLQYFIVTRTFVSKTNFLRRLLQSDAFSSRLIAALRQDPALEDAVVKSVLQRRRPEASAALIPDHPALLQMLQKRSERSEGSRH